MILPQSNQYLTPTDWISAVPFLLLFFAIISLWLTRTKHLTVALTLCSLLFGILSGQILPTGLVAVTGLFGLSWFISSKRRPPTLALITFSLLSVLLAAHWIPGFKNWQVLDHIVLSEGALPYSMYLNLDKPYIGLALLMFFPRLLQSVDSWKIMIIEGLPIVMLAIVSIAIIGLLTERLFWQPKFPDFFHLWALNNLVFTCVAEEAFFRGFLQQHLTSIFGSASRGKLLALTITSLLFGLAHFGGGLTFVLLASVAGLFYGYIYQKTGTIEGAILCHFLVNLCHFLLLTYPLSN